jgi:hypothetical protein
VTPDFRAAAGPAADERTRLRYETVPTGALS